jgi:cytochrome c-type biogenesis protein CcmE
MSVDKELEQALKDSDGVEEVAVVPVASARKEPKRGSPALMGALVAMTGAIVVFVLVGFKDASIYAMPVDEAVAQANKLEGRKLRVDGELVPGSLDDKVPCKATFVLKGAEHTMPVSHTKCELPDTFRDRPEGGVMVTVEGELKGGTFAATNVMAKCTSKYESEEATYDKETHELILPDGRRVKAPPKESETIR